MNPDPSLCSAILEQSADAIIYADREGIIRRWNLAAERLFGFAAGQAVGQSLDLIIPERLRAPHWAGYHRAIAAGQTRHAGGTCTRRGAPMLGAPKKNPNSEELGYW